MTNIINSAQGGGRGACGTSKIGQQKQYSINAVVHINWLFIVGLTLAPNFNAKKAVF